MQTSPAVYVCTDCLRARTTPPPKWRVNAQEFFEAFACTTAAWMLCFLAVAWVFP